MHFWALYQFKSRTAFRTPFFITQNHLHKLMNFNSRVLISYTTLPLPALRFQFSMLYGREKVCNSSTILPLHYIVQESKYFWFKILLTGIKLHPTEPPHTVSTEKRKTTLNTAILSYRKCLYTQLELRTAGINNIHGLWQRIIVTLRYLDIFTFDSYIKFYFSVTSLIIMYYGRTA